MVQSGFLLSACPRFHITASIQGEHELYFHVKQKVFAVHVIMLH